MFHLSIVTPNGKVFDGQAEKINVPGLMGWFEVQSGHMPFLAAIKSGKAKLTVAGQVSTIDVGDGVVEVSANHDVLILTETASGTAL